MSSRGYQKRTRRSKRKLSLSRREVLRVEESAPETVSIQLSLPIAEILADMGSEVERIAGEVGLALMEATIASEVNQRVGERYRHNPDRSASRWGFQEGSVFFAGQKMAIKRPRIRDINGNEVPLKNYETFGSDGRMQRAVAGRVLAGVSTRNYAESVKAFGDGYGIDRSSVSRHWKAASPKNLKEFMERPLDELDLAVLMIDGTEYQGILLVVALGIDTTGKKHVLGFWEGATENTAVCDSLLDHLIERGFDPSQKYLFVLDGSKALRKSVTKRFGKDAIVHRCIEHKKRNILGHLSRKHHNIVKLKLRNAWNSKSYKEARRKLLAVADYLRELNESAARSLEEALEDTLTLHRLRIPEQLRRALRTTNTIESVFSSVEERIKNVKRWRSGSMVQRWAGTILLEKEKRFRRIKGCREMPTLMLSLRPVDTRKVAG